ncbi:MAG: hypothetical protein ABWJ42_02900 [Sulfolobales archaeon]
MRRYIVWFLAYVIVLGLGVLGVFRGWRGVREMFRRDRSANRRVIESGYVHGCVVVPSSYSLRKGVERLHAYYQDERQELFSGCRA